MTMKGSYLELIDLMYLKTPVSRTSFYFMIAILLVDKNTMQNHIKNEQ